MKIYCKDNSYGTGFFCNINISLNYHLKVLITNNHILNTNDILFGQTIKLSINNANKYYNILIDKNRKKYKDESYDVTIIEIKEEDKIDTESFFDLDKQIFYNNANEIFTNCQIYLLHYLDGIRMGFQIE